MLKILDKSALEQNIEKIAKYDMDNNNVFGSSYFVMQKGKVIFKKHFGYSDSGKSVGVDDNTIYRLASMTKPITAIAALILIDRGLISLDDPVSKYISGFDDIHIVTPDGLDLGPAKTPVTVLHCLTHTSGFGCEKTLELSDKIRLSMADAIECYINAGLDFEPFSKQAYSSWAAFDVIAAIVEKVTGQDYGEFLKNEIFAPCGMTNTTFSPTENQWKRVITMHSKVDGESEVGEIYPGCVFERFPGEHKLAGAGLASTLDDYSKFASMLLGRGQINDTRIVAEDTFRLLATPHVPAEIMPGSERWGLAVRVIVDEDYHYLPVGSFGWSGAYGSHFWVDPQNEICAVFMKNSRFDGGAANCSARKFEEAVFNSMV